MGGAGGMPGMPGMPGMGQGDSDDEEGEESNVDPHLPESKEAAAGDDNADKNIDDLDGEETADLKK